MVVSIYGVAAILATGLILKLDPTSRYTIVSTEGHTIKLDKWTGESMRLSAGNDLPYWLPIQNGVVGGSLTLENGEKFPRPQIGGTAMLPDGRRVFTLSSGRTVIQKKSATDYAELPNGEIIERPTPGRPSFTTDKRTVWAVDDGRYLIGKKPSTTSDSGQRLVSVYPTSEAAPIELEPSIPPFSLKE